jgi:TRAP-type transport system periplasmic protein
MKTLSLLAFSFLLAGTAHAQVQWKLATGYKADSFHGENLARLSNELAASTKGSFQITLHANNSLVKLAEIYGAVKSEKLDAGESIMTGLVSEIPIAGADAVPFVVSSYAQAEKLWKIQKPLIEKHFASRGLKLLYAVPWPPQGLYSVKPLVSTSDLKGLKMRTYNSTTVRIAELVGAQGVDVPMVQIKAALEAGKVESMITSAVSGVENTVWTHLKHYYEINAWLPKNVVYVNAKRFNELSTEHKAALMKAAADAESRGWTTSRALAQTAGAELKKNGIKVEAPSAALNTELKRLGERFSREWIASVGPEANTIFLPYYGK